MARDKGQAVGRRWTMVSAMAAENGGALTCVNHFRVWQREGGRGPAVGECKPPPGPGSLREHVEVHMLGMAMICVCIDPLQRERCERS